MMMMMIGSSNRAFLMSSTAAAAAAAMNTRKGDLFNLNPNSSIGNKKHDRASVSYAPKRKLPVLLFDVMDTIVRDPFYQDIPAFFGMPMRELLECKHPTAWIEFEKGLIDEEELSRKFFIDKRDFDFEGLKDCIRSGYSYLDGMQELLQTLSADNFEIHAFTNYPIWYKMIEDKLKLSAYLSWTFCSCYTGKRKPDPEFYLEVVQHLGVEPCDCVFIDDRPSNVKCAVEIGMRGLVFENADSLLKDLSHLGINVSLPNI
ncbi:flavin mononucleotide hydrolase 1, chloroplatic [Raphanus sativus]|uniref:Flavin mononucleotide hydrolase 1, chloroplatic n=1 Tax=Raphanus sativus TaxID=3726 RepID=A0A6J0K4G7_RAPSA|nr:flavin mononucleotide hydrolase 1, chloroplatic [Raphanus sativus]